MTLNEHLKPIFKYEIINVMEQDEVIIIRASREDIARLPIYNKHKDREVKTVMISDGEFIFIVE